MIKLSTITNQTVILDKTTNKAYSIEVAIPRSHNLHSTITEKLDWGGGIIIIIIITTTTTNTTFIGVHSAPYKEKQFGLQV